MISLNSINPAKPSVDLANLSQEERAFTIDNLNLYYGEKQALHNVCMAIPKGQVTAFIGPSGCGKSTLLRCLNRMNDLVDSCKVEGKILLDQQDIYHKSVDVATFKTPRWHGISTT